MSLETLLTRQKGIDKLNLRIPTLKEINQLIEKASEKASSSAATRLYDSVMLYAESVRASDIHLEPDKLSARIRLRIDGILYDTFEVPPSVHLRLIALLKIRSHMRTDEHRSPQDGRDSFVSQKGSVDIRASIMPTSVGEKAVLRLLSSESHKLSLEQLGFEDGDFKKIMRAVHKPWGMILTTGPTGAGKTTTIYAILEILNKRTVNISSIEDPVEFYISGINQSQVDHSAKLTFANGLRSIVRQDPDIIMVGEIRDEETAKIAVNAALTGHKLLSTLHTNNAATTIPRLIDMGVEPFLLASTLIVTVSQRLMRRACEICAKEKKFTRKEAKDILEESLIAMLFEKNETISVVSVAGCDTCNQTGYKGRIGIYEVLEVTDAIQKMIIRRASSEEINQLAISEGMVPLATNGVAKIRSRETSIEEFVRVMQE